MYLKLCWCYCGLTVELCACHCAFSVWLGLVLVAMLYFIVYFSALFCWMFGENSSIAFLVFVAMSINKTNSLHISNLTGPLFFMTINEFCHSEVSVLCVLLMNVHFYKSLSVPAVCFNGQRIYLISLKSFCRIHENNFSASHNKCVFRTDVRLAFDQWYYQIIVSYSNSRNATWNVSHVMFCTA